MKLFLRPLLCFNNPMEQFFERGFRLTFMLRITAAMLSSFLICCRQAPAPKSSLSFKDSIIKAHFANIDSLEFYDTTDYNYRTLKAYLNDDTAFFEEMSRNIKIAKAQKNFEAPIDSCLRLKKLSELNAEEVYRFSHSESFCFYRQRVTISKTKYSISLHYLEYSATPDGNVIEYREKKGVRRIGPGCRIEKEFHKSISIKEWELFAKYVAMADFWRLKDREYHGCCDGSFFGLLMVM